MPRWLIYAILVPVLAGAACYACWAVVMAPFKQREAAALIAFEPLEHLRPEILHNGFGHFHIEFHPQSKLTDDNVAELLSLNKLPADYDLTLWLMTPKITDASMPVLLQLTTTDTIVIEGAGLTPDGIARLAAAKPQMSLCDAKGKKLRSAVEGK
jgi:hypothetical protein